MFIRENPNVDWAALRADKTLRLKPGERWLYTWKTSLPMNISSLGSFNSQESAAEAILSEHKKVFDREYTKDVENAGKHE